MHHKTAEVLKFRKENLDYKVVELLIEATEKITIAKIESDKLKFKGLFSEIYFTKEYRYFKICNKIDLIWQEVTLSLLNPKSIIYNEVDVLKACINSANECKGKYGAFTAKQFLKINLALYKRDALFIDEKLNDITSKQIDNLWEMLYELYDPQSNIPILIRVALFYYELESLDIQIHHSLKQMMLDYMLNSNFNIDHTSLFTSFRTIVENIRINSLNDFVLDFLTIMKNTADDKINLLNSLFEMVEKTNEVIQVKLPKLYNDKVITMLVNYLTLNNNIVQKELEVSTKTAISYLKQLEDVGILSSVRIGKELYYIRKDALEAYEGI